MYSVQCQENNKCATDVCVNVWQYEMKVADLKSA